MIVDTDMASVPFVSGEKYQYNATSSAIFPKPAPPPGFTPLFMQEVQRYIDWWNKNFYFYNLAASYRHGIPEELTVTTAAWLKNNNYKVLQILFVQSMVAYGYGDYREVPIVYMLHYLTPDVTMALLKVQQGMEVHIADFHEVLLRYAKKHIRGKIHLSTTITQIDRSGDHPTVKYHSLQGRKSKIQQCSALILAFPPTISALLATGLDINPEEAEVFTPVGTHSFYSGAVRMNTPSSMTFAATSPHPMIPPTPVGEPVVFVKLHPGIDIAMTSSWGPYRGATTKAEAYSLLKNTLSKFNKDPRSETAETVPVTDEDVLAFQENDYFPHFDEEQLVGGWYEKFEALQGRRGTYWASGFNMFELVEYAIRAGEDVVKTYF
ncbi:hypothetical protein ACMFMF_010818 [Clarireedia jacksonii]